MNSPDMNSPGMKSPAVKIPAVCSAVDADRPDSARSVRPERPSFPDTVSVESA